MGKHTDYAGGRSLLAAISKAFCVVATERSDNKCHFYSTMPSAQDALLDMVSGDVLSAGEGGAGVNWVNYPKTALVSPHACA
jgi:galactokinase